MAGLPGGQPAFHVGQRRRRRSTSQAPSSRSGSAGSLAGLRVPARGSAFSRQQYDLGEVPLLCNPGEPHCPKGYTCVRFKRHDCCLREGADPNRSLAGLVDGGGAD